ncbi:phage holin family protein [Sphingomonas sp. BGYR3]|uniref:phage holin family protein n=1 Tax=Sphingomonas sp. BGYR3 TaxID=2975483 RepID=UPI0021A4D8EC|nr:phage holin family protein [Sphingomonas sp. BGYR3]
MADEHDLETVPKLMGQLVKDARAYAKAEAVFAEAVARDRARDAIILVGLGAGALAIGTAIMLAILVGLMLLLQPVVGLVPAMLFVIVPSVALVALLALTARSRARRLVRPLDPTSPAAEVDE